MGEYEGNVSFQTFDAAEYIVFTDGDASVTVFNEFGMQLVAEDTENVDRCNELTTAQLFDMNIGRYFISFSGSSAEQVALIIEEVGSGDTHDSGGDECEADVDRDGIINENDNCPEVANPAQLNTDGLGTGDACELVAPNCQ